MAPLEPIPANSLSFVILNYNSDDLTVGLLSQIQNLFPSSEKVVVSNGDSKIAVSKVSSISYLVQVATNNNGYAAGNNVGFAHTRPAAEYVIFLNPDVRLPDSIAADQFLSEIGRTFIASNACVAAFNVQGCHPFYIAPKSTLSVVFPYLRRARDKKLNRCTVYRFHGAAFVVKKARWSQPAIFEEKTFLYFEEDIFSLNLSPYLKPIRRVENIEVLHASSATVNTHIRWSKYRYMYNSLKLALIAFRGRPLPIWDEILAGLGILVLIARTEVL